MKEKILKKENIIGLIVIAFAILAITLIIINRPQKITTTQGDTTMDDWSHINFEQQTVPEAEKTPFEKLMENMNEYEIDTLNKLQSATIPQFELINAAGEEIIVSTDREYILYFTDTENHPEVIAEINGLEEKIKEETDRDIEVYIIPYGEQNGEEFYEMFPNGYTYKKISRNLNEFRKLLPNTNYFIYFEGTEPVCVISNANQRYLVNAVKAIQDRYIIEVVED